MPKDPKINSQLFQSSTLCSINEAVFDDADKRKIWIILRCKKKIINLKHFGNKYTKNGQKRKREKKKKKKKKTEVIKGISLLLRPGHQILPPPNDNMHFFHLLIRLTGEIALSGN